MQPKMFRDIAYKYCRNTKYWHAGEHFESSFGELVEALVARLPLLRLRHLVVSTRSSTSIFSLMSHGYKGMDLA